VDVSFSNGDPLPRPVGVKAQEPRSALPCGVTVSGVEANGMWVPFGGNTGQPQRESRFEGENPMSAAGGLTARSGSRGANRQEGDQTLKAEPRQPGKLPDQWTLESHMC
jgi:hypothetical protein